MLFFCSALSQSYDDQKQETFIMPPKSPNVALLPASIQKILLKEATCYII